ncbi:hypothetical protein C8029_18070 [Roseobacter sp. TSBP12]|nr:hypothetical protein C8029_18070 [Roseobacter sp. TSBP12]
MSGAIRPVGGRGAGAADAHRFGKRHPQIEAIAIHPVKAHRHGAKTAIFAAQVKIDLWVRGIAVGLPRSVIDIRGGHAKFGTQIGTVGDTGKTCAGKVVGRGGQWGRHGGGQRDTQSERCKAG